MTSPDAAETANFLRRFADLMSNGQNAAYLHNAAVLLESLSARVTAASEEEQLWRYKYETVTQHADALEAECDTLKHDIEGHLDITSAILGERDALKSTLQAQENEISGLHAERSELTTQLQAQDQVEAELRLALDSERQSLKSALQAQQAEISGLHAAWDRERSELTAKWQAQDKAAAEFGLAFDSERESLNSMLRARDEELEQLRSDLEREREDSAARSGNHERELSELRVAFDRERSELQVQQKVLGDELATLRLVSRREYDALTMKIADLETKRAELRSAFNQISDLRNQAAEHGSSDHAISAMSVPEPGPLVAQRLVSDPAPDETSAVVPKTTLRQVRAQFEYLAKEFIPLGDIASQVMCELGAYTMDLALNAGREIEPMPVAEAALSILTPPASTAPVITDAA